MPRSPGTPKTGGRRKGSRNKSNRGKMIDMLDELGINPAEGLALIASDIKVEIGIRAQAYANLLRYVHPQLKAVQHSGSIGKPADNSAEKTADGIISRLHGEDSEKPSADNPESVPAGGAPTP